MSRWHRLGVALALACFCVTACAQRRQDAAPILVLISFDGWRSDYIDRVPAPNLRALAARGVRASALIPSFPTFTFPNHYTIVTGLYPGHHGIVANIIADSSFPLRFTMSAATAIRQGLRAAPTFWPGAEAAIGGVRPTYWEPFDDDLPNAGRVARALER